MNDFIEYWSAARLLLEGKNPYSPELMLSLQSAIGWTDQRPLMMWNPPWSLTFVLPFGFLGFDAGKSLWLLVNLLIVFVCIDLSWRIYNGPKRYFWLPWLVGLSFFPTLFVLRVGQITPFVLLGVVGFIFSIRYRRYGLASCSTVLISLKPHLLYLFWVALLCWVFSRRQWRMPILIGAAFLIATIVPLGYNPSVIFQFVKSSMEKPPLYWMTPTIGGIMRFVLGPGHSLLQFLPTALSLLFFLLVYWKRLGRNWAWDKEMPLLLLISVSTAAYGWSFDLVVLIPALIQATIMVIQRGQRLITGIAIFGFVIINTSAYWLNSHAYNELCYVWMAPVLLASFVIIQRLSTRSHNSRTTFGT
jgi:hypothetical protein